MFFPRLRRQAKWMFVLLAIVFGFGFVIFGVGSNLPSGLGDVLVNPGGSGDGTLSEDEARDRIAKNPRDVQAYRELATALQQDGKTAEAIAALERYIDLRPRDADILQSLAGLHLARANRLQNQLAVAQVEAQEAAPLAPSSPLTAEGQPVIEQDPIAQAATAPIQERINRLSGDLQTATTGALRTYKQLARVEPTDPSHQLLLGQTAEAVGEVPTAIAAYRRFTKLTPEDPNVPAVKSQIKLLERSLRQPTAG